MAVRPQSQHGRHVIQTAALLCGFLAALPATAAPAFEARCDEAAQADLDVAVAELKASPVSSNDEALEGHLLEQRIDAAARSVFADDNEAEDTETVDEAARDAPPAEAGGPTASDREPTPLRRQMYRRDI